MEEQCESPAAFLIEYNDGFRATLLQLNGFVREWVYAARVGGKIQTCELKACGEPYPSFSYLGLNIQQMFLTGEAQYPVERTLLVTGGLDALMNSRYQGHVRLETPQLDVAYQAPEKPPIRPVGPKPCGASVIPFDSSRF